MVWSISPYNVDRLDVLNGDSDADFLWSILAPPLPADFGTPGTCFKGKTVFWGPKDCLFALKLAPILVSDVWQLGLYMWDQDE